MKVTVEIDKDEITEAVKELVIKHLATAVFKQCYEGNTVRRTCYEAIKEVLYEPKTKQEIIQRAVNQAAQEIRRKAMPLLADKLHDE